MRYLSGPVDRQKTLKKNNVEKVDPPKVEQKTMSNKWTTKKLKKNNVGKVGPKKLKKNNVEQVGL